MEQIQKPNFEFEIKSKWLQKNLTPEQKHEMTIEMLRINQLTVVGPEREELYIKVMDGTAIQQGLFGQMLTETKSQIEVSEQYWKRMDDMQAHILKAKKLLQNSFDKDSFEQFASEIDPLLFVVISQ